MKGISIYPVTFPPKHHFFGYYDKSPWDSDEHFILAMEVDFIDRLPDQNDKGIIGVVDLHNDRKFIPFTKTLAWNWQQGCMLQWLPPFYSRYFIFNNRVDNRFVSIIMDIATGEKKILPLPVYSIHPGGEYAVTINFARLDHTRKGYGYAGIQDTWIHDPAPEKDGIYFLNLKTGENRLIISLARLYAYNHLSSMDDGKHWVEHLMFNRDGSRFCFLHRWQLSDGGIYTRLFTADLDGTDIYCLLDSGNFSHFSWRNNLELLGWGRLPGGLNRLRKSKWLVKYILKFLSPLYRSLIPSGSALQSRMVNSGYLLFRDKSEAVKKIGAGILKEDGHCSWSPDMKWILTDTYPDKYHLRNLILFDYDNGRKFDIGSFYSLPHKKYGVDDGWDNSGMRCDLHPRWNRDGTKVCIDSVHEGSRQMYVLDLREFFTHKEIHSENE